MCVFILTSILPRINFLDFKRSLKRGKIISLNLRNKELSLLPQKKERQRYIRC